MLGAGVRKNPLPEHCHFESGQVIGHPGSHHQGTLGTGTAGQEALESDLMPVSSTEPRGSPQLWLTLTSTQTTRCQAQWFSRPLWELGVDSPCLQRSLLGARKRCGLACST